MNLETKLFTVLSQLTDYADKLLSGEINTSDIPRDFLIEVSTLAEVANDEIFFILNGFLQQVDPPQQSRPKLSGNEEEDEEEGESEESEESEVKVQWTDRPKRKRKTPDRYEPDQLDSKKKRIHTANPDSG